MDTLLIRNGTVVNAEDGTMVQADILAEGSRIRKAEPGICDRAVSEIDATGCYVTPGLVDHHTHIYPALDPCVQAGCLPLHPCEHRGAFQPSGGHGGCGSAPYGRGGDPGAVPAVRE